jgi:death-on-curing protein
MSEPIWLKRVWVDAIHFQQLQRFGGLHGARAEDAVELALARPRNQRAYDDMTDIATLAAAYGFGLTRGHGYVDGNKRVGFVAMATFLDINSWSLEAPEPEVVRIMLAVASGELDEAGLASWVRGYIIQTPDAALG